MNIKTRLEKLEASNPEGWADDETIAFFGDGGFVLTRRHGELLDDFHVRCEQAKVPGQYACRGRKSCVMDRLEKLTNEPDY